MGEMDRGEWMMNKIVGLLQFFGLVISGIGCYMVFHEIMIAMVLAFLGLAMIFTSIQIAERSEEE